MYETDVVVLVSAFLLCIPPAIIFFVQFILLRRAQVEDVNPDGKGKAAKLYSFFDAVYLSYTAFIVVVAAIVALRLSEIRYAKRYLIPASLSFTLSIVTGRRKKGSGAEAIFAKVLSNYAEHARKTGITGVPLMKENVAKDWPPFALFLRSFHLERGTSNPLLWVNYNDNSVEREFNALLEEKLNLVVLGLGKEVLSGAARLELSSAFDWKVSIFVLAAAADVIFIWPGASEGTIWEMDLCLNHFKQKAVFYSPKLDPYFALEAEKKLCAEINLMSGVLRDAGFETPTLFAEDTFWIYSADNSFRSFTSVVEAHAYVNQSASDRRAADDLPEKSKEGTAQV